jgi:hypothetical protein
MNLFHFMRMLDSADREIAWTAPQGVRDILDSLGRTEDVRFSPSNRRLAVAGFNRSRIVVLDIEITRSIARTSIAVTRAVELASSALKLPHGVDFIDENRLAVADRACGLAVFAVPDGGPEAQSYEATPIQTLAPNATSLLNVPGSLCVGRDESGHEEILVCNNDGSDITRHRIASHTDGAINSHEIVLRKWLSTPDGVSVSRDRRWLAVSNHGSHSVMLYKYGPSLKVDSPPDGILRGVYYPHGVRFSADGRHLFVADAGAPYVNLFTQSDDEWQGVHHSVARIRVMDESLFARGNVNATEGGPKGIDIDACQNVLAAASVHRSLVFFDLPAILSDMDVAPSKRLRQEPHALEIEYELFIAKGRRESEAKSREMSVLLTYMNHSKSWQWTAPLRRLHSLLQRDR